MAQDNQKLDVFPAFFKVSGKAVIVVGNGDAALSKLRLLSETSANLVSISPNPSKELRNWLEATGTLLIEREFSFEDAAGAALVFSAQDTVEQDQMVVEAARLAGAPVNAVDRPDLCDFITPSIVNRSPVVVAISTNGAAPVLARRIKASIERLLPTRTGLLAQVAGGFRSVVEKANLSARARRLFWEQFFDGAPARHALAGNSAAAEVAAHTLLNVPTAKQGFVSFIHTGAGDADLLTLRAHKALQDADVIVHDASTPTEIMRMGRRDAEIIELANHTASFLADKAAKGLKVVRLSTDEQEASELIKANIAFEIIPHIVGYPTNTTNTTKHPIVLTEGIAA